MADDVKKPARKGKKWLVLLVVGFLATGAGAALPVVFLLRGATPEAAPAEPEAHKAREAKPVFVPFGDVIVNLSEARLTRYLRVKLVLVVDEKSEKATEECINANKVVLKNWLIGHLSGKSLKEVTGTAGVNRLGREIREEFNNLLFPGAEGKIRDALFEEFVVQ